jgi:MFS family permease
MPDEPVPTTAGRWGYPRPRVAWYTVGVLFMLYLLSLLDRLVISLLVAPIRRDLGISDFELSLLQGFAFGAFYAVCGLPLGWMVDRFSRRWIVFWGVTVWSISTAFCGFARSYFQLFLARVGVGAGEASLSPAAYSILADSFPPHRLTTALAVFSLGSLVGSCLAFMLGGYIVGLVAEHESVLLPLIGEVRSWQVVFLVVGIPGAMLGLLMFTFAEPLRRGPKAAAAGAGAAAGEFLAFLKSRRRFIVCHHAGFTLANAAMTGLVLWAPAYLSRSFGWKPGAIGLWLGLVGLLGGLLGALLHGQVSDRWFARGIKDAQMRWYSLCAMVALPVGVGGMLLHTPVAFLATFFMINLLIGPIMGVAASSLQIVTPPALRGRASSLYLFVMILLGIGAGPSIVAALTDFVFHDDKQLGLSLALVFAVAFPLSALVLRLGLKASREAVDANHAAPA